MSEMVLDMATVATEVEQETTLKPLNGGTFDDLE